MSIQLLTTNFGRIVHKNGKFLHQTYKNYYPKIVPYILSDIGEGIVEVVVKEWYVKPGDKIAQFDPVCEVQSDKASVTITSRFDGLVDKIHYDVDGVAKVGAALLDISVDDNEQIKEIAEVKAEIVNENDKFFTDKALATPAVRRIARENKIDLSQIPATGKAGRVLKEDILAFMNQSISTPTQSIIPKTNDFTEELIGIQKAMSKTMTAAWKIPHLTFSDEIDVTELLKHRKLAQLDQQIGVKVTAMPFLVKATSMALLRFPRLNSQMDETGLKLTMQKNHNLGIAMDTPQGLLVPNIKKVQNLTISDIAEEMNRLQLLAHSGKLTREDLEGGTLTLSNIGAIGGIHANPIILPPQCVIGAFGKIQKLPRFDENNQIVPRNLMMVSWAADHRALDGATIAKFSKLFQLYISSPALLSSL